MFANLYETLRFQETADRLCVSQSALIKHIHKLGEELGISLFDRSTRSVRPNVFSETFSPYAEQIVRTDEEARRALKDLGKSRKAHLRLAFALPFPRPAASTGSWRSSPPLPSSPPVSHHIAKSILACEMLKSHQCVFAFANDAIAIDESLSRVVYKVDRLALYVPT